MTVIIATRLLRNNEISFCCTKRSNSSAAVGGENISQRGIVVADNVTENLVDKLKNLFQCADVIFCSVSSLPNLSRHYNIPCMLEWDYFEILQQLVFIF